MKVIVYRDRIQDLIMSLQSTIEKGGEELVVYDSFWVDDPIFPFVYFDYSEDNKVKVDFVEKNYKPTTKVGMDLKETMLGILRERG